MATAIQFGKYIGQHAWLRGEGMLIGVVVMDAKSSYGQTRFYVTPEVGVGGVWVDAGRVKFQNCPMCGAKIAKPGDTCGCLDNGCQ